ncbi:hypothetical protein QW131_32220 [Roseibium salinum]|nr:hypothetical protein [Roseibium salinum]
MASSSGRIFAEEHPEVVTAFLKAVIEAGNWIEENPSEAVDLMEKWTGVEKEVLYIYFSNGGHLTLDPTIKDKWVDALKLDHTVLVKEKGDPATRFRRMDHRGLYQGGLCRSRHGL